MGREVWYNKRKKNTQKGVKFIPKYRPLNLTETEKNALVNMRDKAKKPYLRERASALLQIAGGRCGAWVAREGLLRRRKPDTVYGWLNRYEAEGVEGLTIRSGRGRKAAYEP